MFVSLLTFIVVVVLTAVIGFIAFGKEPEVIQGQIEVSEYRVSSKLPGRIVELRVKEGDFVRKGDTLAILEVPEIEAKRKAADAGLAASAAFNTITDKGARKEQIQGAYQLWQQAQAAQEITKKSYTRAQNLFDEGVITAQKRDEAYAAYKAAEAAVLAAKSQYDLAKNGARTEEKEITREKVKIAQSSAEAAHSLQKETVQIAQYDGEISEIYPKVVELVGTGSPIMSIAILKEMWGTFNVREDQLQDLSMNSKFKVFIPAFNKEVTMQTYYLKDQGSYAAWRATKASGQYDLKTFEVKARFVDNISGVRPGMSLVIKR